MRLLLDSHAFLWFILGDQRLSDRARLAIAAADTDVLISPATLWEMAIKVRLGKYTLPDRQSANLSSLNDVACGLHGRGGQSPL